MSVVQESSYRVMEVALSVVIMEETGREGWLRSRTGQTC